MRKKYQMYIMAIILLITLSGCFSAAPESPETPADAVTEVESVKELLDAIKPGAKILVKPGQYNLSRYIEAVGSDVEKWNEENKYVKLAECYDGLEIIVERVDGISIKGSQDVEIVTDPRYAAVLNFEDCQDISLLSLTMGHTERGDCAGNVLNFTECENIELRDMDIYGCGVYGIGAYNYTDDLRVYDSIVRDCMYGPLEIFGCIGSFEFYDTVMKNNSGYSYIEAAQDMDISFYRCDFGVKETEYFMFNEEIYTEDCTFSEDIEVYPEYGDDVEPTNFDDMKIVPFDKEVVADTSWTGVYAQVMENGNSFYLPSIGSDGREANISIRIDGDGTGALDYYDDIMDFIWYCDSQYNMTIKMENEVANAMVYTENKEGENPIWLLLHIGETAVWMRQA